MMLCQRKLTGRKGFCNAPMREYTHYSLGSAHTDFYCERCEWQQEGKCWSCGKIRERPGKQVLLCFKCKAVSDKRSKEAFRSTPEQKHKAAMRSKKRWATEKSKEHQREVRKKWYEKNPHKVAEYKANLILNSMKGSGSQKKRSEPA